MKNFSRRLKISAFILSLGLLIVLLSSTLLRDWLIISFGIRTQVFIRNIGFAIIGGTTIGCIIKTIPRLYTKLTQEHAQRQQHEAKLQYAKNITNPTLIRQRLTTLLVDRAQLVKDDGHDYLILPIKDRCEAQLDQIDSLQDRQTHLIQTNDAVYLQDTIEAFDAVEDYLCRNIVNIINLCFAPKIDYDQIERYLADNQKKLNDSEQLFSASIDWINRYNAQENHDRSLIENWIAILKEE